MSDAGYTLGPSEAMQKSRKSLNSGTRLWLVASWKATSTTL